MIKHAGHSSVRAKARYFAAVWASRCMCIQKELTFAKEASFRPFTTFIRGQEFRSIKFYAEVLRGFFTVFHLATTFFCRDFLCSYKISFSWGPRRCSPWIPFSHT